MKTTSFRYSVFILLIGLLISTNNVAQENDATNYKMKFNFKTVKQYDNSRLLEVSFIGTNKKDRKDKIPIYEAEIKFFNILTDNEILLGTSKTSKEGISQIILPENQEYLTDDEGNINITARFEGTDALDEEEDEIIFKDLHLELHLKEIDSVKTVLVKAYTINNNSIKTPAESADIIIAVEAMLSKLKIAEESISDGTYEFEFPTDIPGDVNDDLTVFLIIEGHDIYGNVFQKETIKWGSIHEHIKAKEKTLWSGVAPIWMYVLLTFLLVGVWANYIYTIINLVKIKNEKGDDKEEKKYTIIT